MCGNMTYPEEKESILKPKQTKMNISNSLKESLDEGKSEGRITCGIYACAKLLEVAPESVMLCLVPVDNGSNDVTNVLLHTLVEAFCWENEIRMLKVDSAEKLARVLSEESPGTKEDTSSRCDALTYSCLLIQYPDQEHSSSDQSIMEYYNNLMYSNQFPTPVIEIPV